MASYQHSLVVAARKQSTHTHTHTHTGSPDRSRPDKQLSYLRGNGSSSSSWVEMEKWPPIDDEEKESLSFHNKYIYI